MIAKLERFIAVELYHLTGSDKIQGPESGLTGDCTGLRGDCTGLRGDFYSCEITDADRDMGVTLAELTSTQAAVEEGR